MTDVIRKTVYIFETFVTAVNQDQIVPVIDWEVIHDDLDGRSIRDRTVKGIIFSALGFVAGVPVFGMHKPINSDFLTRIDKSENSITDLMEAGSEDEVFAHSTAFAPIDSNGRVGLCRGDTSSPTHSDLAEFLRTTFDLQPGERLDIQNVMSRPQVREFERASEVNSFSARYSTQRDLTNHDLEDGGLVTYSHQLSDAVSGDVIIAISVKLATGSDHAPQRQRMKKMIDRGLPVTAAQGSGARATVIENGLEHELRLVAHHMGVKIELPEYVTESRMFTNLAHGLVGALPAMKEELRNSHKE